MTDNELEELISECPVLYHMAERGAWESICDRGLLSTSAILDLYGIEGVRRRVIESERRLSNISIDRNGLPRVVVRDQLAMTDRQLQICLRDDLTPVDWYKILNNKVFFWLTRDRLCRLTRASEYRHKSHDVIEVNTRSLIQEYRQKIWLCPMNSGNTKPFPHGRGRDTFLRIPDYPYQYWRERRSVGERVVELAIDYRVPDILQYVDRVVVMREERIESVIYE